jgi:GntR family transcriptional regulator
MEFYIDGNSSTPVAIQIQEQIKLAVMMGVFRSGDTLPSIRDIEKQTGINRSHIHKAYLALKRSGLLLSTRGKGTIVTAAIKSPRTIHENCHKLSRTIISKVRQMGLSPMAFSRYLIRYAQENERHIPFIIYVDSHPEMAARTAEEISQLWHVPVIGVAYRNLMSMLRKHPGRAKILVNHLTCDYVRSMISRNKSDVIPIELNTAEQAAKMIEKMKPNSTVVAFHMPQPAHRLRFILGGLRKMMEPRGIRMTSCSIRSMSHFRALIKRSRYDYYLVGPAVRGEVPHEMQKDPRILQIHPQIEPASLESARIRAGVII